MTIRIPIMMSGILLVSCMAATPPSTPATAGKPVPVQTPISEMDTDFLYMAAEDAVQNNKPLLAIRFLEALVNKDKSAVLPRIRLAELLLRHGQTLKAKKQVEILLGMPGMPPERMTKIRILNAQVLTANGENSTAIKILQRLLRQAPESFATRMMLIRLMEKEGRFDEAHQIIHAGIKTGSHIRLRHIDAELYIHQGKLKEARRCWKPCTSWQPISPAPF